MADTNGRNFRYSYVERSVIAKEEKKELEGLLKECPVNIHKLAIFCQNYLIPAAYRLIIWKILLGINPIYTETHEFVKEQQTVQYNDIHETITIMNSISLETPLSQTHLRMFLVDQGTLPFDCSTLMVDTQNQLFISLSEALKDVDDKVDHFWLTVGMCKLLNKHRHNITIMIDSIENCLQKEDSDGRLYKHLSELDVFQRLPLETWFYHCFASVLPESSIEIIWDKVIGGAMNIMLYTAVSIFITFKRALLSMKDSDAIKCHLSQINQDNGDIIVMKAIDLWKKNGSILFPLEDKVCQL